MGDQAEQIATVRLDHFAPAPLLSNTAFEGEQNGNDGNNGRAVSRLVLFPFPASIPVFPCGARPRLEPTKTSDTNVSSRLSLSRARALSRVTSLLPMQLCLTK